MLLAGCVAREDAATLPSGTPLPPAGVAGSAPPATPEATSRATLTQAEVVAQRDCAVSWRTNSALVASCLPPETDALAAIPTMGASQDRHFVAPLIDMRWLDLDRDGAIEDELEAITGKRRADRPAGAQIRGADRGRCGGDRWFVNERALVSTLDGRKRPRLVLRQGYWLAWQGAQPQTTLWRGGS